MAGKTVLILGGGTGGLVAANRLRRMLAREHRVLLVDRSPLYSFAPSFLSVALGTRTGPRISRDLLSLEKKGIEVKVGEVRAIQTDRSTVTVREEEVAYDYLVIALGAQYSVDEVPGLGRTWTFYHLEGAEGLSEELPRFKGGRLAIVMPALPYKCPPAPYEAALVLDDYFRRRRIREDVEISLYTPEATPLVLAGEAVSGAIARMLEERGIRFLPDRKLASVDHKTKELEFGGGRESYDMTIATPVHRVPDVLVASGLAPEGGWVRIDRETMAVSGADGTALPRIYAVGDCTAVPLAGGGSLPKAGVIAHGEAEVVARNIAAEIAGGEPIWAFGGQGACFLQTGRTRGAYLTGDYFSEPPRVELKGPGRYWHWSRQGFERLWLWRWF